jgi:hypothetical protein
MNEVFSPARRHERFSVVLSVICRSTERGLADQVVNLSLGGACVKTPVPLPPGTRHRFAITVPDAKLRASVVDVEAVVAWSADDAMGLRFAQKSHGIDDYLRRLERASNSI